MKALDRVKRVEAELPEFEARQSGGKQPHVRSLPVAALAVARASGSSRKLIIISSIILLATPVLSQGYNGPSPQEIQDAVRDGVLDALQDSGADIRGLSREDIRDAVRDGILAADEELRRKEEFQAFLQQQELMRQQEELAHRARCQAHPSMACP
jgi:hypothetical protein